MLRFLRARSVKGVEMVRDDAYLRTVRLGSHAGWIAVRDEPAECALLVESTPSLAPALPALLDRLRDLFDLHARPDLISAHFARDPVLAAPLQRRPGLRVPGAFDGFELATRAILGQQITVKAATTIAGRFAAAFGEPIETPHAELTHLSPVAERVSAFDDRRDRLARHHPDASAKPDCHRAGDGERSTDARPRCRSGARRSRSSSSCPALARGPRTTLRCERSSGPTHFPKEDIALRNALGRVSATRAEQLSQSWRPWRSYATIHLWCEAGERASGTSFP